MKNKLILSLLCTLAWALPTQAQPSEPSLCIKGEGATDMIWTWWFYPQVITHNDVTFWTFATKDGYSGIAQADKKSLCVKKTMLRRTHADDHNGMAFVIMDDGRLLCSYAGGHNIDNKIHIRLSKKPYSIEEFEDAITLVSNGKQTTYSQILHVKDTYYLFYRVNNKTWVVRTTKDGRSWSEERTLVTAPVQYYCKVMPTTDNNLIRICMYSNPQSKPGFDTRIRMGFLRLNDMHLLNADAKTDVGTDHIDYRTFNVIIDNEPNKIQRMFDVAVSAPDDPRVLYCTFSTDDNSTYMLHSKTGNRKICNGGLSFWRPKYQGGASFLNANTIVLSREEKGYDHIETYMFDNKRIDRQKEFLRESIGPDTTHRNIRPICDINGKDFVWQCGYYDFTGFVNFNMNTRFSFVNY
ncbi:MAG: BNR-4 repeat-containing protein [Bacteroidales bacterium]|nr:BNR-4 repeat-containing protein [Bacteroidales bacterium]